jgi:translation initiation factor 1
VTDDIDPVTGLPEELGIEDDLSRESELTIRVEKRRYDKPVTVVEGFDQGVDLDEVASELKRAVGAGGTVTDGAVEIQGDHRDRLPDLLADRGFQVAED